MKKNTQQSNKVQSQTKAEVKTMNQILESRIRMLEFSRRAL